VEIMGTAMRDPFYLVKEELQDTVKQVDEAYQKWSKMPPSATTEQLGRELEDKCVSILWQVDELDNAVKMSERDLDRFKLTPAEVAERRRWVEATRAGALDMQRRLREARKQATSKGDVEMGDLADPLSRLRKQKERENEAFVGSQEQEQHLILARQDEDLEALGKQVGRIGEIGLAIGEELKQQSGILDQVGDDMDGTQSRLKMAQRKVQEIMRKTSGKAQCYIIIALCVVLAVLMLLTFM